MSGCWYGCCWVLGVAIVMVLGMVLGWLSGVLLQLVHGGPIGMWRWYVSSACVAGLGGCVVLSVLWY